MERIDKDNEASALANDLKVTQDSRQSSNTIGKFLCDGKVTILHKEENPIISVTIFFFLLGLNAFIIGLEQHLVSKEGQGSVISQIIQDFYDQNTLYRIAFLSLIFLKIFLVVSVFMEIILKKEVLVVSWINKKCVANFTILKQLDLSISGIMLIVSWKENLAQLLISGGISLFHAVYLQDYINRRDHLYVSSSTQFIFFRIFLLLNSFSIALFFSISSSAYFACYSLFSLVVLLTWYLLRGHELYFNNFSKNAFLGVKALYLTFYVLILQSWILDIPLINLNQVAKFVLTLALLVSFMKMATMNTKKENPKSIDLQMMRLLQKSASEHDSESLLTGLLHYSFDVKCDVPIDYYNGKIYDSCLKESVARQDIYVQKESAVRLYTKSTYKKSLEKEEDAKTLLEFCEFLVSQMDEIYQAMKMLTKAKRLSLNIVQRVKVSKLQLMIRQRNRSINSELYGGKLEIEHIIEAENCFNKIQSNILQYISDSLDVWSSLQLQEVEMSEIRKALQREMKTIEETNVLWKDISKYFKTNNAWRFVYINYVMFIQNEKIKQKELDFLTNDDQQAIFNSRTIFFEGSTPQDNLYDPEIIFNQNSCCFFATYQHEQLCIKDVNSRFTRTLGYTKDEIKGSSLDIIMPHEIVADHRRKFKDWISSGQLTNEASYHPRFTSFITKESKQVPAIKYYKAHYIIECGLLFICLLKTNQKTKIVANDHQWPMKRIDHQNKRFVRNQATSIKEIDINCEKSIFLKEDTLLPNKTINDITYVKIAARMFTLLMITVILIYSGLNSLLSTNLTEYSSQFISFMNIYRYPFVLDINYMKRFLRIGSRVSTIISSTTTQFLDTASKSITAKTLFDVTLNTPRIYQPYVAEGLINEDNLSHIDLFYTIVSSIATLRSSSVNRNSPQYKLFSSYLTPSYDNMMNNTKLELQNKFEDIFFQASNKQLYFIIGQSIIVGILIVILLVLIHKFGSKLRNIFFVFLDFRPEQVNYTYNYWKEVRNKFARLLFQGQNSIWKKILTTKQLNITEKQFSKPSERSSMNKQAKYMKQDQQKRRQQKKMKVYAFLIMLTILAVIITIQIIMKKDLADIQTFENDGFFFLRYFPVASIVARGCVQKYFSERFPNEVRFDPKKYEDSLSTMFIFGNSNYIGQMADSNSLYYIKQKTYFFGSPCEFNSSVLSGTSVSVSKCLSFCNGTFKQGMSSFLRYGQWFGDSYINSKSTVTVTELDDFTLASAVLSAYVLDAIDTWTVQFQQKVADLKTQNYANSIIIIILILVVHLSLERYLIGYFERQYEFVKKIYLNLVPEFILVQEKVIRQKFVIEGIIDN